MRTRIAGWPLPTRAIGPHPTMLGIALTLVAALSCSLSLAAAARKRYSIGFGHLAPAASLFAGVESALQQYSPQLIFIRRGGGFSRAHDDDGTRRRKAMPQRVALRPGLAPAHGLVSPPRRAELFADASAHATMT